MEDLKDISNVPLEVELLVTRYVTGEASDQEKQRLKAWKKRSDLNRRYVDQMERVASFHTPIDTDKAWKNVQTLLFSPAKVHRIPLHRKLWFRIAASVLVLLTAGALYYFSFTPSEEQEPMVLATQDEILHDTLQDGSTVILNKNSSLTYYYGEERRVVLSGEAFFNVVRDPATPFVITSDEVMVEVLGTRFNVKAYPDQPAAEVVVQSGRVSVEIAEKGEAIVLTEGEKGVYLKEDKLLEKKQNVEVFDLYWVDRTLRFEEHTLKEVVSTLSHVYPDSIALSDPDLKDCLLTTTFHESSLEEVLDIIALTLNLDIRKETDHWILTGDGCGK